MKRRWNTIMNYGAIFRAHSYCMKSQPHHDIDVILTYRAALPRVTVDKSVSKLHKLQNLNILLKMLVYYPWLKKQINSPELCFGEVWLTERSPLQDRAHRPWPASCGRCESAPGSIRWTSRCSVRVGTSCCSCTEGFQCTACAPARRPAIPLPTSTSSSGPRCSAVRSEEHNHCYCK